MSSAQLSPLAYGMHSNEASSSWGEEGERQTELVFCLTGQICWARGKGRRVGNISIFLSVYHYHSLKSKSHHLKYCYFSDFCFNLSISGQHLNGKDRWQKDLLHLPWIYLRAPFFSQCSSVFLQTTRIMPASMNTPLMIWYHPNKTYKLITEWVCFVFHWFTEHVFLWSRTLTVLDCTLGGLSPRHR